MFNGEEAPPRFFTTYLNRIKTNLIFLITIKNFSKIFTNRIPVCHYESEAIKKSISLLNKKGWL